MINRRRWLKAVGYGTASSLMAPYLFQIASAQAGGESPKRFLFVVEGNGFEPITMLGNAPRQTLEQTLQQPLGSARWWYRNYTHAAPLVTNSELATASALTSLGELASSSMVLFGLSSLITGGSHSALGC